MQITEKEKQEFKKIFGHDPEYAVRAPGRINLIGEHTDYNEGYVLPVAIDRKITYIASVRQDGRIALFSKNFNEKEEFSLKEIPSKKGNWGDYARGPLKIFLDKGFLVKGMNVFIEGDVPLASGLSSSAAMEVGMSVLLKNINNLDIVPLDIIKMSQKAENEFVGVSCGIMDQFASCLCKKNSALFLDCRDLEYKNISFDAGDAKLIVCNTKVKRELKDTAFNKRRQECSEAVNILGRYIPSIKSLRDVSINDFQKYQEKLVGDTAKRCLHVLNENQRVLDAVKFIQNSEIEKFAQLLFESHKSLRDLYEVSCPELDAMVEISLNEKGVLGARMTGGGFGGCAIALVKKENVAGFCRSVFDKYKNKTNIDPEIYPVEISDGAMN